MLNEVKEAGTYVVEYQSAFQNPQSATEIYFYQLEAGEFLSRKKMTLIH